MCEQIDTTNNSKVLEMKFILVITIAMAVVSAVPADFSAESFDIIEAVNSAQTTWKAGNNFPQGLKKSQVKRLLGLKKRAGHRVLSTRYYGRVMKAIPQTFDARDQWPGCASISHIYDQSDCGSCWAVSAAAAFSDRLCIATDTQFTGLLSSAELLTCCLHCGDGCDGGYDDQAWRYFKVHGIVSGGDYNSTNGCQPYPLQPCEHHVNGSRTPCDDMGDPATPICYRECTNTKYKVPFRKDHHKTKKSYMVESTVEAIQQEILNHGPVQAGFTVYADFLSYKTGVYQHVTGEPEGGHAVRVIGWGMDNGTEYWLVANSWNSDWGDNGYFKIKRGNDECGFESEISAGIPEV